MKALQLVRSPRLVEAVGLVCFFAAIAWGLALATYTPLDPSWNTATSLHPPHNWIGRIGSYWSDLTFQTLGLAGWFLPFVMGWVGFRLMVSGEVAAPYTKALGLSALLLALCSALSLASFVHAYNGAFPDGGVTGIVAANWLTGLLNPVGTWLLLAVLALLSLYLISTFSIARFAEAAGERWAAFLERSRSKISTPRSRRKSPQDSPTDDASDEPAAAVVDEPVAEAPQYDEAYAPMHVESNWTQAPPDEPPFDPDDIPIRPLEEDPASVAIAPREPEPKAVKRSRKDASVAQYHLPPATLLNEPPARESFDSQELKDTASKIKAKLEEFNVLGNVVQINPGPVVTTFEFKPDAGVKIARITTLSEDLCLGLQAESILVERIPGKPTVGIEVPNSRREMISLRQILESEDFFESPSRLTFAIGKDISGRIRIAELDKMPHLLIAGSTGSGKSVMLNALIMSVMYKSTPDDVRMIMIDPKRLELGLYEGIPHLLTPVITEPKKATNALRNAVLEMERRLKLLASYGVRNIEQFNKKIRSAHEKPMTLFPEQAGPDQPEERPLPYVLIIIDELADLMMQDRAGVEESIIRLAQMARAVGMHLVVATQRPSVDVITGLIKANFPARISFRVATRVDSRTVLDVMGAEHLLGKGDMLFLPPGTARLLRVHGAFVTESEINDVVRYWKGQAAPEYDQSYLLAPPNEDDEAAEEFDGEEDPLYQDAVRVVLEMGKASTSILQRRLRLGYGRAARILDMMQHEGIIGPPDGSRPREVLKRPDWLDEVEESVR